VSAKYPESNFLRSLVYGFLGLLLSPIATFADGIEIEKGSVDLLKSEALSRPFTVFDQLLYGLEGKANEDLKYLLPRKNDFTLSEDYDPNVTVGYAKGILRVGVTYFVRVSTMNEPWREVCERHVQIMASLLGVSHLGSQVANQHPEIRDREVRGFFSRYLGSGGSIETIPVSSLQPFVDAILVSVEFSVERSDKKGLAYERQCLLDIKSNRIKYYEYKY